MSDRTDEQLRERADSIVMETEKEGGADVRAKRGRLPRPRAPEKAHLRGTF